MTNTVKRRLYTLASRCTPAAKAKKKQLAGESAPLQASSAAGASTRPYRWHIASRCTPTPRKKQNKAQARQHCRSSRINSGGKNDTNTSSFPHQRAPLADFTHDILGRKPSTTTPRIQLIKNGARSLYSLAHGLPVMLSVVLPAASQPSER